MKYYYNGIADSKPVSGVIEAQTEIIAKVKLRNMGITPLEIRSDSSKIRIFSNYNKISKVNKTKDTLSTRFAGNIEAIHNNYYPLLDSKDKAKIRISEKDVFAFIRQFAIIIKSGVPLLRSFDIIINGLENQKFVMVLTDIRFNVQNGVSLFESFSAYPQVFDKLFLSFLLIGDGGGVLDTLLERYIVYSEKTSAVKRKIKSSLSYPFIVICVATLVVAVVLGFVVPQFQKIFADFGVALPLPTIVVIKISNLIVNYGYLLVIGMAVVTGCFKFAYRKNAIFHFHMDAFILKTPLVNQLIIKSTVSKISRTLSLLFSAGVPINQALSSVAYMVDNYVFACSVLDIKKQVEAGTSLSKSIENNQIYPNLLVQMVSVGEESGSLEYLLNSTADYYEDEVEMVIESLLALIEPVTITFLGVVLGGIIIAIYLPLFNLGNVVS